MISFVKVMPGNGRGIKVMVICNYKCISLMPTGDEIGIHSKRRASASKINVTSGGDADAGSSIEPEELAHGTLAIFLTGKIYGCLNHDLLSRHAGGSISYSMTSSFAAVTQK